MQAAFYNGYSVWGHAIRQHEGYAASGTINIGPKLIEASGVLGHFSTGQQAESVGLDWARARLDSQS
jgi:hypothetical protein